MCRLYRKIRGLGLLIGIELESSSTNPNTLAEKIMYECLNAGLSFKVSMGTVLTLAPPLNIEQQDLERALEILILAVRKHSG